MVSSTRFCTLQLVNSSITISASDNVSEVSVLASSSTVSITGNVGFQSYTSSPVQLGAGQALTLSAGQGGSVLDGVTIAATGTAYLVFKF